MPVVTGWWECSDGKHLLVTVLAGEVVGAGETLVFWSDNGGRPCDEHGNRLSSLEPSHRFPDGPDFGAALARLDYTLTESAP